MILVRPATEADVPAMSVTLIASITALCTADHRNDPEAIARWTANKTEAGVLKMLEAPGNQIFVAERDGAVAAVGCVMNGNEIGLNYVHPAHRFQGVSRALLSAMEDTMCAAGTAEATLKATTTAHRFYLGAGWVDSGPIYTGRWIDAWPMRKRLR
ncbi:MAG: GNAT family N-acetyltransferase [Devosia sp.]